MIVIILYNITTSNPGCKECGLEDVTGDQVSTN